MRFSSVRLTGGSAALNHFCETGDGVSRAPHRPASRQGILVKKRKLRQVVWLGTQGLTKRQGYFVNQRIWLINNQQFNKYNKLLCL